MPITLATRETVFQALFDHVAPLQVDGEYVWKTRSRKMVLWAGCPRDMRPAIYLAEREQGQRQAASGLPVRSWKGLFVIYTDASNCTDENPGSKILNPLVDYVEQLMRVPLGAQFQTLGGVVHHAFIEGEIFFDPGDLDGDGMAIIPITLLVP